MRYGEGGGLDAAERARRERVRLAADLQPLPMIRSPSQWPGTARSAASAGRSLIITMSLMRPVFSPRPRGGGGVGGELQALAVVRVAFPGAGTARSAGSAGRSVIINMSLMRAVFSPRAGGAALGPPGAQAAGQLAAQLPPALHIQRLVE